MTTNRSLSDGRPRKTDRKSRPVTPMMELSNKRNWAQGWVIKCSIRLLYNLRSKYFEDDKVGLAVDEAINALERLSLTVDRAWGREKDEMNAKQLAKEAQDRIQVVTMNSESDPNDPALNKTFTAPKAKDATEDEWFRSL